jgi:glycosyltransferase involved in cell wall biosynthesis
MPYNIPVWVALHTEFGIELSIVHWDKKKLTPYRYTGTDLTFYKRSEYDRKSLLSLFYTIKPDALFVSGRMDKDYLHVARYAKMMSLPVVMGSDKQWKGNWKDWIFVVFQKLFYRPYFTHACVPGLRQRTYCLKVGFSKENIIEGLYSANVDLFKSMKPAGEDILFVGRLEPIKGIGSLVNVVRQLRANKYFFGKLRIYGNGSLKESIPNEDWIICREFSDQELLKEGIEASRIFCLPSLEEPWGVVIHEMAAAGLLICCSDACGAGDHFVKHGVNGMIFKSGNWSELENALKFLIALPESERKSGQEKSVERASRINPRNSARQLMSVYG